MFDAQELSSHILKSVLETRLPWETQTVNNTHNNIEAHSTQQGKFSRPEAKQTLYLIRATCWVV